MHVTTRLTALAVTVLLSLTPAAHAGEEQLSREQAGCIVAVNKAFAGVVNSAAKAAARCGRELASGAASLESCLAAANTAKAEAKTASAQQKKCEAKGVSANSTFAYIGDASAVNEAGVDETLAIATKLIGSATPDSSDAGRCQETVLKGVAKYASTLAKETVKQKKKSLKGKLGAPPETAGELAEDLGAAGLSAKVGAAAARLATKAAKKCAVQDLGTLFPGGCGASSTSELAQCGEDLARCHFCRALNVADGLALDCAAYSGLATCGLDDGICGDGTVTGTEQCDDGNTTSGDGCDDQCVFESVCGDGALEGIEQCDDGNTTDGDGCSSLCLIEGVHICGDGEVSGAEQCDDGNTTSGDGCSSACAIEEMHVCGDGAATGSEECDDGNSVNGDGCDENCVIEIVEPFCGDGTLDLEEQCDDGNTGVGDGCDENCLFEVCGNGVLQNGETCDDGNQTSGDGCSDVCQLEIAPVCGNGVPEAPEECDDGNTVSGDGCSNVCLIEIVEPFCGDGNLDEGEQCDDGNTVDGDACDADCTVPDQVAPEDARFNGPLDIPLDNTASVLDFVSFPNGDTEDRVRYDVLGMNQTPGLPGGQARLIISATCFGEGTDQVEFFTGGQTFACGDTLVDRIVTANSDTGTVTITAVGGVGTYVQWVLTGTATRTN